MGIHRTVILYLFAFVVLGSSWVPAIAAENEKRVISPYFDHPDARYYLPFQGFKNVANENGDITGFQLHLRSGYYRGVYMNLLENFEVTVDGERFDRERITFSVQGATYSIDELADQTDKRWQWADTATLTVSKPGGLEPGMHIVEVIEEVRISYMPVIPSTMRFRRELPLVY